MLTTEEFHAWCQRFRLSPETEAIITRIRESPPVRKVRGRANNVSGKYPSPNQNVKTLQDYWAHPVPTDAEGEALILESLAAYPGVSVAAMLRAHPRLPVDLIWAMLSACLIFTDLDAPLLTRHEQVLLYRTESEIERAKAHERSSVTLRSLPSSLVFDSRLWQAEIRDEVVILQPEVGTPFQLPLGQFQRMVSDGEVKMVTEATPSPMTEDMRHAFAHASPKAQERANWRWGQILAYTSGEEISTTPRSVQRWMAAYQTAEKQQACGYLGLLDHVAKRGNRTSRVEPASLQLLTSYLKEHYAAPQAKRAVAVYRLYRKECRRQQIPPVSERTFYREREKFTTLEVTTKRHGRRAAYAEQPFFWYLDQTTPRHGERPFAIAHLDHTPLDILLVSSVTGKPFAKPYLTMLTDAYSRRCLALSVTYDPPSYRSAMMLFRLCVKRHRRLPQELVVDRGSDYGVVSLTERTQRYAKSWLMCVRASMPCWMLCWIVSRSLLVRKRCFTSCNLPELGFMKLSS